MEKKRKPTNMHIRVVENGFILEAYVTERINKETKKTIETHISVYTNEEDLIKGIQEALKNG